MHYFQRGYFPNIMEKVLSAGGTGVHIFFFCSGFGLFMSYTKRKVGYLDFLKRRFLKIYIPYIIVIAIWLLLLECNTDPLKTFLAHAFLYKMFMPLYEETPSGVFWYISTLFQFYFLFVPLVKVKEIIGNKKFLYISCFLSVVWWIFTAITGLNSERVCGSFFLQYLWEFAIGIVIAERLINGKDIKIKKYVLLLVGFVGLFLAGVLKMIDGPATAVNDLFAACGYGSIALLIYSLNLKYINKIIIWISSISYEWYLVHMLVITILSQLFTDSFLALISIPISLFIAWLYKRLIDVFQAIKI